MRSSQEKNGIRLQLCIFFMNIFSHHSVTRRAYFPIPQRFPWPQTIHFRGTYFLKKNVLGDWGEKCPVAGFYEFFLLYRLKETHGWGSAHTFCSLENSELNLTLSVLCCLHLGSWALCTWAGIEVKFRGGISRTIHISEQQRRWDSHERATLEVICLVPPMALSKEQHWGKQSLPQMSQTGLLASSLLSFLIWKKKKNAWL